MQSYTDQLRASWGLLKSGVVPITLNRKAWLSSAFLIHQGELSCLLPCLVLIDPLPGVALTDLTQGLVLVAAGPDVVGVEEVVVGLLVLVSGFLQL